MNRYQEYSLEDFVLDAQFQNWVRYKRDNDVTFWGNYVQSNVAQSQDIMRAKTLLESVYVHYESHIDDSEIDFEIQELLSKVRNSNQEVTATEASEEVTPMRTIFRRTPTLWAAATIVLMLGLGWLYQYKIKSLTDYERLTRGKSLQEEQNESNVNRQITLTDGSRITLMPHAKISFPEHFNTEKREVYLSGKASFQVSKDAKRPFFVYANQLVTKVLGTTFTVTARDAATKTSVEVEEGKVSVFRENDFIDAKNRKALQSKGMVLTANQKVVYERESANMIKTISDSPQVIPGKNVMSFNFVNTPASDVLSDLENAYQVEIIFDKDILRGCPITASLTNQSLYKKLNIICEVIEARYEMLDGKIVVYSKGCKN